MRFFLIMRSLASRFSRKSFLWQLKIVVSLQSQNAQVAELVDALVSGTSVRKDVQVRALSRAQKKDGFRLFFCFVYFVENHVDNNFLNILCLNFSLKKLRN